VTKPVPPTSWFFGIQYLTLTPAGVGDGRFIQWKTLPVAPYIATEFKHEEVYQLAAKCLYLERKNIEPSVESLALFDRHCAMALPDKGDKYALIYCMETFAETSCKLLKLIHPQTGSISRDVKDIDAQIAFEVGDLEANNRHCQYRSYLVCTQEGYKQAERSITLNFLRRYPTQRDYDTSEVAHLRSLIQMALSGVDYASLPREVTLQELLLGPYLFTVVAKTSSRESIKDIRSSLGGGFDVV
jgi:hypothetical protein